MKVTISRFEANNPEPDTCTMEFDRPEDLEKLRERWNRQIQSGKGLVMVTVREFRTGNLLMSV